MITKTIQIYVNNLTQDIQGYLNNMYSYYKEHDVILNYDITPVNVSGYQSVQKQMAYGGNTVYVLRGQENLVPTTDHDMVMFVFDLIEWKAPWYSFYPILSTSPRNDCELVNGKPFINIGVYSGDQNGNQMAFYHEPMHAFVEIFKCQDQMDTYYKNNLTQFKDVDSNFSIQWNIFKPYLITPTVPVADTSLDSWGLVPSLKEKALKFFPLAKSKGFNLKITQGFRDPAYQNKLYAQGRTLPGKIVTNATGKTSKHCLGKAFDIAFVGKDPYPAKADWKAIGTIGKSLGLQWGGDWTSFKDLLHFEI